MNNIFSHIPEELQDELCESIIENAGFRLERIVSRGHVSPDGFWYDQEWPEWVMLLKGMARLRFDDGRVLEMRQGDHVLIPAHCRHRVDWTAPDENTVWLAVHYRAQDCD